MISIPLIIHMKNIAHVIQPLELDLETDLTITYRDLPQCKPLTRSCVLPMNDKTEEMNHR